MNAKGTVIKYGDNIDTDVIIPARYLNTSLPEELAKHCMEDIDKEFVKKAYPVFPSGMIKVYEKGYFSLGLCDDEKILLAVWKIDADSEAKTIDLSQYVSDTAEAKLIYPTKLKTEFNFINKKLPVKLDEKYSARLFEIKI